MKSRLIFILINLLWPISACAEVHGKQEEEIVRFLVPMILGENDHVENLRPSSISYLSIDPIGQDPNLSVWTGKTKLVDSDYIGGDKEDVPIRNYFRSLLFKRNVLFADSGLRAHGFSIGAGDKSRSVEEIIAILSQRWGMKNDIGKKYASAKSDGAAYMLLTDDSTVFGKYRARFQGARLSDGTKFDAQNVSDSCVYFEFSQKDTGTKLSLSMMLIDDDRINFADGNEYFCVVSHLARHLDLRALQEDKARLLATLPSGDQLGESGSTDCTMALLRHGLPKSHDPIQEGMRKNCDAYSRNLLPIAIYYKAMEGRPADQRSFSKQSFSDLIRITYRSLSSAQIERILQVEQQAFEVKPYQEPDFSVTPRPRRATTIESRSEKGQ